VLNVALVVVFVSMTYRATGDVSSALVANRARAPMVRTMPTRNGRSVSAFAENKQVMVRPRPADLPKNKVRIRVGAPLAAAATAGVCNLANVFPALAAEGKIFDFDLTLPYMTTEIILLSFFLDKLWFSPLGKLLEQRDQILKDNLESASGNLDECDKIVAFAEQSLYEMRSTINAERDEKLSALNAECDAAMAATKEKVNARIEAALTGIENDRKVVLSSMGKEIEGFCWEILGKVVSDSEMKDIKALNSKMFEKVAA